MNTVFYISAAVAVLCTLMVIVTLNVVHSLLYLVVSLLAVAVIFFVLGAPFAAALEVIIYAGAIMVLFVFVVMLLNVSGGIQPHERGLLSPLPWVGPSVLALILVVELIYVLTGPAAGAQSGVEIVPKQVGIALFGPYLLAVELASFLLLAGLVGAFHIGRRLRPSEPRAGEGV